MSKKVRLMIELDENKYRQIVTMPNVYGSEICESIRQGIPYNPSGDLVSREALKKDFKERNIWSTEIVSAIDNAPTVEARTQGEWEDYSADFYKCPECGYLLNKLCPQCYDKVILPKGGAE